MLTDDQRHRLVAVARSSVLARVGRLAALIDDVPGLPAASGVFVTIRTRGELRGCLGTLECGERLVDEIARCAAEAASVDPRFPPVTVDELEEISIEVSVLGPLEPIDPNDPEAVVIGMHGLVVEHGRRRGLLLPQVAIEWSWTREQFLSQTCIKAGLPVNAWRRGAAVFRFAAEVFGDE
ncbi:MAG TPA: AmmeMemoRadiSam system protein A [Vicinamibacterales bacterium]|nr:AmmeMemoRadiSam system protein A [Vicinamibacterales bacterium]